MHLGGLNFSVYVPLLFNYCHSNWNSCTPPTSSCCSAAPQPKRLVFALPRSCMVAPSPSSESKLFTLETFGVVTILVVVQRLLLKPGSKCLKSSRQTFWEIILFFFFFFMLHLRYYIKHSCPYCCRVNIMRVIALKSSTVTKMHA